MERATENQKLAADPEAVEQEIKHEKLARLRRLALHTLTLMALGYGEVLAQEKPDYSGTTTAAISESTQQVESKEQKTSGGREIIADRQDIDLVLAGEFRTTKGTGIRPALKTLEISACIAVTVYDPENEDGALGHFVPFTPDKELQTNLETMILKTGVANYTPEQKRGVEVRLIGGKKGVSEKLLRDIKKTLKSLGFSNYVEIDYGDEEIESIAFDTRTGKVFDLKNILPVDPEKITF